MSNKADLQSSQSGLIDPEEAYYRLDHGQPVSLEWQRQMIEWITGRRIERKKRCGQCGGVGRLEIGLDACPFCDGSGYRRS